MCRLLSVFTSGHYRIASIICNLMQTNRRAHRHRSRRHHNIRPHCYRYRRRHRYRYLHRRNLRRPLPPCMPNHPSQVYLA